MLDPAPVGLLLLVAGDAGVYASAARGASSRSEFRAEVSMFMGTAVAIVLAALLSGRAGAGAAMAIVAGRCAWDALHIGRSKWIELDLDARYPPAAIAVKAAAAALVAMFAFPA